jgi:hypothetical protein
MGVLAVPVVATPRSPSSLRALRLEQPHRLGKESLGRRSAAANPARRIALAEAAMAPPRSPGPAALDFLRRVLEELDLREARMEGTSWPRVR